MRCGHFDKKKFAFLLGIRNFFSNIADSAMADSYDPSIVLAIDDLLGLPIAVPPGNNIDLHMDPNEIGYFFPIDIHHESTLSDVNNHRIDDSGLLEINRKSLGDMLDHVSI